MFEGDEELLRKLSKECKDSKEQNRYLALHALCKGYEIPQVAEIFCVDECTIYRWIERWEEEKNVQNKDKTGRPQVLDDEDKKEIKHLIEENNPKKHGINASFWDTKELRTYFQINGKNISRETIRSCIKEMGGRYVKSQIKYPEADIEQQRAFARSFFEQMKTTSAIILFHDEMSAGCSARKGYGWTFEERLEIKVSQRFRQRMNCFGAVNPIKGEVIQMASKESKAPAFVKFLHKIDTKYRHAAIIIYLDNLPVHKSAKVKKYLESHKNIRLEFLPPYSPEMNLQEEWWNYERSKFLNNRNFRSTHQLATSVNWFAKQTSPEQVMSVCSFAPLERLL